MPPTFASREWMKQRETAGSADLAAATRQVRAFLETHGASRFQLIGATAGSRREKSIRTAPGSQEEGSGHGFGLEYLILREVFRSEVCRGFNYKSVLRRT